MDTGDKLRVLEKVATALNRGGVTWAVGASLLLWFKGIVPEFNDIDILVDEKDVPRVKNILAPFGPPRSRAPNEKYRTRCFLEYVIDGVDFDIIAGFIIVAEGREHYFPLKKEDIMDFAELGGTIVPLQALEQWREYYTLMGRSEKVALIDKSHGSARRGL